MMNATPSQCNAHFMVRFTYFIGVLRLGHGEQDGGSEGLWQSIALRIPVRDWCLVLVYLHLRYHLDGWYPILTDGRKHSILKLHGGQC